MTNIFLEAKFLDGFNQIEAVPLPIVRYMYSWHNQVASVAVATAKTASFLSS